MDKFKANYNQASQETLGINHPTQQNSPAAYSNRKQMRYPYSEKREGDGQAGQDNGKFAR